MLKSVFFCKEETGREVSTNCLCEISTEEFIYVIDILNSVLVGDATKNPFVMSDKK